MGLLWVCMWWLIFGINLTRSQGAQMLSSALFWVCLWECFEVRLMFESVDWINRLPLRICAVLIRSVDSLSRLSKKEFALYRIVLSWDLSPLLPWNSDWSPRCQLFCPQAFVLQISGLLRLHEHLNQFPRSFCFSFSLCLYNKYIYNRYNIYPSVIYLSSSVLYLLFVLFLWRTLIQ